MKRLTERTEIAKAINFNKYPVIKIDLSERDEYGIKGTKVRFDIGEDYFLKGEIRAYNDTKYLVTTSRPAILKKEISYSDYLEDVEYANTPIIKANQEIVIFLYDSEKREIPAPAIIKTGERIDEFCMTPLTLEKLYVIQ